VCIAQTLSFFSFTLPQIVGSVYALMREGFELYKHRQHVDPLALAHPVLIGTAPLSSSRHAYTSQCADRVCRIVGVVRKLMGYFKYHFIEKRQRDVIQKTRNKMSRLVSNALDGLADIQVPLRLLAPVCRPIRCASYQTPLTASCATHR
jgi:hypothetical protein